MNAAIGLRRRVGTILLAAVLAGLGTVVLLAPSPAVAASKCTALTKSVHLFVDAKRGVNVLTYNSARFAGLKKSGYTDTGVIFNASNKKKGLTAVHVMYDKRTHDRIYTTSKSEIVSLKKQGYADNSTGFYAYTKSASCLAGVYRLQKGKLHRFVTTAADRSALTKQGWSVEKTVFWVAKPATSKLGKPAPKPPTKPPVTKPPSSPGVPSATANAFTIAVMPDTQMEVLSATDPRFAGRSQWLVAQRSKLNLKFVTHVGDIVNWDTPDHAQYQRARAALGILNANGIPYSLSPGNHDTAAVCPGGSACPGAQTWVTVRNTSSFDTYLNGGTADLAGSFEPYKVDNIYSRFTAGGRTWLVLNLELWPRKTVVAWAASVVASHPHDNVMVVTHSYLTSSGGIYQKNGGYGATSPQYLYDNVIGKYPNVRLVFSGHVGKSAHRIDHGVKGNRIDSFLLCMHDNKTNPIRLVQMDPSNGLLKTWVYAPYTKQSYPAYDYAVGGIAWVK